MTDALLYGVWREETFVILDAAWAHQADDELRALEAIRSWDELVAASRSLTALEPPIDPALGPEEYDVDPYGPLAFDNLSVVADGDFPPMPGALTERFVPADSLRDLETQRVATVLNGDYLVIPPEQEPALIRELESRGFTLERDDALIARLGREE